MSGGGSGKTAKLAAFLGNQNGKDKLLRTVQYASRMVAYWLQQRGAGAELVDKLGVLEKHMSMTRKAMRWGKIPEIVQGLRKSYATEDSLGRLGLAALRTVLLSLYVLFDHINHIGQLKLVKVDARYWSQLSAFFWMWSIWLSMLSDYIKLSDIAVATRRLKRELDVKSGERAERRQALATAKHRCNVNYVKNVVDLPIAIVGAYRLSTLSNGTLGLLGTISSVVGMYQVWTS